MKNFPLFLFALLIILPANIACGGDDVQGGEQCQDGLKNGEEVGVDCGGDCSACTNGQSCDAENPCTDGSGCLDGMCSTAGAVFLNPTAPPADERFALDISYDDRTLAVLSNSGFYIFDLEGGTWVEKSLVVVEPLQIGALSSLSLSGDTLAVGNMYDSSCAAGINGDETQSQSSECIVTGAVRLYKRSGDDWIPETYIKSDIPGEREMFGETIVLKNNRLYVGATSGNADQLAFGQFYIFEKSGDTWSQTFRTSADSVTSRGNFGGGISVDGERVLVGEQSNSSYLFTKNGASWDKTVIANERSSNYKQILLSGGHYYESVGGVGFSGARSLAIHREDEGVWTNLPSTDIQTDVRFALAEEGIAFDNGILYTGVPADTECSVGYHEVGQAPNLVPCHGTNSKGAVMKLEKQDDGKFKHVGYYKPSHEIISANVRDVRTTGFGQTVIAKDGFLIVSAPYEGSCATGLNGNAIDVSCEHIGAVYIYPIQ